MTIRSHLLLLAIGVVLPVLAFAIFVSVVLVEQDRSTVERAAMDRARAMMTAVDAELRGSIKTVLAISASPALQTNDLAAFHAEAMRMLATQPTWLDLTLTRPSGEKVLDAQKPLDRPGERVLDPASLAHAVRTGRLVIGDVDQLDASSPPGVPIRVPVMLGGHLTYVLTAIVRPDSFQDIVRRQRLPESWISGIVDAKGNFVARIPARPAGEPASSAYRAAVLSAPEGWYRGLTVEGNDAFTAHERSESTGWSIGLAIPAQTIEAAAWRTAWLMGIGVALSIMAALGIAMLLGRRIAAPVVALASAARSIGSGGVRATIDDDRVREVSDVAAALRDAGMAVREREQLIEREKSALQEADRAKDEFIAALSHELRNPLAALTAAAHVLRVADPADRSAADARGVIDRQTRHLSRMTDDLLDVSRLIAGKVHLRIETFDLGALAAATVGAWHAAGRFSGQVVTVDARDGWVTADRTRVEQILSNLLDNAVKFTPPGRTIAVHVAQDAGATRLAVADGGEGIEPALVDRVFDVFVQGDQDVGRSKGGIGLGLTIVKRLAQLQGGSVGASSAGIGHGATFTVRLPAAAPAITVTAGMPARAASSPRNILLVEDNDDARDMLRQVLAMQGHAVFETAFGEDAIALAGQTRPDVAIIDIGLPDIDGYEVAQRLKARSPRRIALIALTGYGQPEDVRRARAAGFDIHLVKPITVERLEAAIASLDVPMAAESTG
jgi:signal transduction histidine kinase/ActR/RegA family two-component response regulator